MFKPKCIADSFSGSGVAYFQAQAKLVDETLHIQAQGTGGNREYGVAFDVGVESEFAEWFAKFTKPCVVSLATNALYTPIQCFVNGNDLIIQVVGPFGNRRAYYETTVETPEELLEKKLPTSCGCYKF
jgi:hypothetical protein